MPSSQRKVLHFENGGKGGFQVEEFGRHSMAYLLEMISNISQRLSVDIQSPSAFYVLTRLINLYMVSKISLMGNSMR
jgi:hypothetical protein